MHYASLTCNSLRTWEDIFSGNSTLPSTLYRAHTIIDPDTIGSNRAGFKPLAGLPEFKLKGFIAAYIGCISSLNNWHCDPHRICNFRTLSSRLDPSTDFQYNQSRPNQLTRTTDTMYCSRYCSTKEGMVLNLFSDKVPKSETPHI